MAPPPRPLSLSDHSWYWDGIACGSSRSLLDPDDPAVLFARERERERPCWTKVLQEREREERELVIVLELRLA